MVKTAQHIQTPEDFAEFHCTDITNYAPPSEVVDQIGHIIFTPLLGGAGVGKDTIIKLTELPRGTGFTNRYIREGEVDGREYDFDDSPEKLQRRSLQLVSRELIQITFGPDGPYAYGTEAKAFPDSGPCLFDMVLEEALKAEERGFGARLANENKPVITVAVPPSADAQINRFIGRGDKTKPEFYKNRMLQALKVGEQVLERTGSGFVLILNDDPEIAAAELRAVATRTMIPQESDIAQKKIRDVLAGVNKGLRAHLDMLEKTSY